MLKLGKIAVYGYEGDEPVAFAVVDRMWQMREAISEFVAQGLRPMIADVRRKIPVRIW